MQKKKRWITGGLIILTVGVIIGASFYYGTHAEGRGRCHTAGPVQEVG